MVHSVIMNGFAQCSFFRTGTLVVLAWVISVIIGRPFSFVCFWTTTDIKQVEIIILLLIRFTCRLTFVLILAFQLPLHVKVFKCLIDCIILDIVEFFVWFVPIEAGVFGLFVFWLKKMRLVRLSLPTIWLSLTTTLYRILCHYITCFRHSPLSTRHLFFLYLK